MPEPMFALPPPPVMQVPLMARHPVDRSIPFANVEVPDPETVRVPVAVRLPTIGEDVAPAVL